MRYIIFALHPAWSGSKEEWNMSRTVISTGKMARLAVLVAILLILAFTPLGYLKIGLVSISFLMIPVAIGAVAIGPGGGAFLGAVFGLTSFAQCFGTDAFGVALLAIQPLFTFVLCMVPRILAGWLPGLLFRALSARVSKTTAAFMAGLFAAVLNTILFVTVLLLLFGQTEVVRSLGSNALAVVGVLITSNALIEALACTVVTGAISKALFYQNR
jgi:uncharacterized membrane protein